MMWYVVYTVAGFHGDQKAGPWDMAEAVRQKSDIEGFEGVSDVRIVYEDED